MHVFPFGTDGYRKLDRLLEAGQAYSQIRGGEFTNHSTLTAEALAFLNRAEAAHEAIEGEAAWYLNEPGLVLNAAPTGQRVTAATLRDALGDVSRLGDLNEFFALELNGQSPLTVIRRYVPILASDVSTELFHGVIQVAHGVRALGVADSPARRLEVARGLAYWAAGHQPLRLPQAGEQRHSVNTALALLPKGAIGSSSSLRGGIDAVLSDSSMRSKIASVACDHPTGVVLETASAMARVFTRERPHPVAAPANQILLLHTVTGAHAVLSLLPLVDGETGKTLAQSLVTTSLALAAVHRSAEEQPCSVYAKPTLSALTSLAAAGREAHVSKAIAAAVAISVVRPDRTFTDFALHAALAMDPAIVHRVPEAVGRLSTLALSSRGLQ